MGKKSEPVYFVTMHISISGVFLHILAYVRNSCLCTNFVSKLAAYFSDLTWEAAAGGIEHWPSSE